MYRFEFLLKHIIIYKVAFPLVKWSLFISVYKEEPIYIYDVAYLFQRSTF